MAGKRSREQKQIKCEVIFTEGAIDRITEGFVWLYYEIKAGRFEGPLLENRTKDNTA